MNEDQYDQQQQQEGDAHNQAEGAAAGNAAESAPASCLRERRRQRIEEHLVRSLENPDSLSANIGAANSEVMGALSLVGQAFRESIGRGPISLDVIERHRSVIDLMVRLTKTIAQASQLEWQFKTEESTDPFRAPWKRK